MMPAFEKLAKNMKAVGIKVGVLNLNDAREVASQYQVETVPKLYLFRPNKSPLEYTRERTAKAMEKFIIENQPGEKHITDLSDEDNVDPFFNSSSRVPRLLLFSSRTSIPPVFKQICYKHRKGLVCGFISETHENVRDVGAKVSEIGEFSMDDLEYPTVVSIDRRRDPIIDKYDGKVNFEALNQYLKNISLTKEKIDPKEQKEMERKKKEEERKTKKQAEKKARDEKEKANKAERGETDENEEDDDEKPKQPVKKSKGMKSPTKVPKRPTKGKVRSDEDDDGKDEI
jgi:hypothetical protein